MVEYAYDAWGGLISATGALAEVNPFRYRGYYYDVETGLYYCQSRYYNPQWGRWISGDDVDVLGIADHLLNDNLFAYSGNDPTTMFDPTGYAPKWVEKLQKFIKNASNRIRKTKAYSNFVSLTQKGQHPLAFYLAGFIKTSDGVYHAKQNCLQRFGGYNDFYDWVFDSVTYMKNDKFKFTYNGREYVIWIWKGDYLNLGAGAEMGFYSGNNGYHYFASTGQTLPMYMSIRYKRLEIAKYGYISPGNFNRFWWITCFNPSYQYINPNDLYVTFAINFSSSQTERAMYIAFRNTCKRLGKRWIFDDKSFTAVYVF
ncbi:MAG: DUF4474 domain-containing protein [Clostridium sp.]|nr:DUF4474 domain-containing protein [Clostridium sp.]